jgi:hypothetical protein
LLAGNVWQLTNAAKLKMVTHLGHTRRTSLFCVGCCARIAHERCVPGTLRRPLHLCTRPSRASPMRSLVTAVGGVYSGGGLFPGSGPRDCSCPRRRSSTLAAASHHATTRQHSAPSAYRLPIVAFVAALRPERSPANFELVTVRSRRTSLFCVGCCADRSLRVAHRYGRVT